MRHEIGHCNGWGADHAGARFENVVRLPVPRPDTERVASVPRYERPQGPPVFCLPLTLLTLGTMRCI
jgi:hypothetical protein